MDTLTVFLIIIFAIGTIALSQTKHERHLKIFFLIRTKYFISVIDFISKITPRFWTFLSDISLTLFFGGVGFAYLSKHRNNNLNLIFAITGFIAIMSLSLSLGMVAFLIMLIFLIIALYSLRERNVIADFIIGSTFITIITLRIPEILSNLINFSVHLPVWIGLVEGSVGVVPIMFLMFMNQAYDIIFHGSQQPGVSPAIPDVKNGKLVLSFPGTDISIPIIYALIAIITLLVSHEFAHGIIARVHGIELKSTGLLTVGILPIGAFVEPDEEKLKNRKSLEKMQIFVAGSFANLLVSILAGILFISLSANILPVSSIMNSEGMKIVGFAPNSTVKGIIKAGEIIYEINNHSVINTKLFRNVTSKLKPGENITIVTNKGSYNVKLSEFPENKSKGYMGIFVIQYNSIINFIINALFWIWFLNFNICFVNLLPIVPFDGWRILEEIINTFEVNQKDAIRILKIIVAFSLLLILLNILPLFNLIIKSIINLFNSI